MYSYYERIGAVEPYIKLGKRVRSNIRQLDYPNKNALKGRYRAYLQRRDVPVGDVRREPKFSQAKKAVAVEHYRTNDQCIAATIRALGYPGRGMLSSNCLWCWMRCKPTLVRSQPKSWPMRANAVKR